MRPVRWPGAAHLLGVPGLAGVVLLAGVAAAPPAGHARPEVAISSAPATSAPSVPAPPPARPMAAADVPGAAPAPAEGAIPAPEAAVVTAAQDRDRRVRRAVAAAVKGRRGTVDLAVTDVAAAPVVHAGAGRPVRTASIVKLLVLRAVQARGPLTAPQRRLATRMITRSDNAATTALWRASGRDRGIERAAAALGLRHTTRIPVLLLPWDGWQTTAEDQVRLLRAVATGRDADSAFTRSLMGQVVPDQAWGVGHVPGATGVKNGWLPVGGRWIVNTDGCVTARRRTLCLSVLSTGSRTFAEGVRTVELAASAAVRAWR